MHNDQVYSRISFPPPSCVDSAMERHAIDQGFIFDPFDLFPENKEYYETKRDGKMVEEPVKEYSYNSDTKRFEPYLGPSKHEHV